ncbi:MAG: hypothetical protein ACYSSI_00365 [Planctomycetota bacterium]
MAKNYNTKLRLVHLTLILLGLFGSAVAAWVWQRAETRAIAKETVTLSEEGCEPAKQHEKQIGIIEYRLDSIDRKQESMILEQKAMRRDNDTAFKEILDRLPPKTP